MDNGASHAPCRPYQLAFAGFKESRLFSKFVSAALASSLSIGICRRLAAFETGAISPVRENRRVFALSATTSSTRARRACRSTSAYLCTPSRMPTKKPFKTSPCDWLLCGW